MNVSDLDIELELLNLPRVVKALDALKEFPEVEQGTKKALKDGGRHLAKEGKQKLKHRMKSGQKGVTGNLLKSFKVTVKKRNRGVLAGFRDKTGGHSWLVDQGTGERYNDKGYYRGKVTGNKFWTDTRNQETDRAMTIILQGIEQTINNLRNRLNS